MHKILGINDYYVGFQSQRPLSNMYNEYGNLSLDAVPSDINTVHCQESTRRGTVRPRRFTQIVTSSIFLPLLR